MGIANSTEKGENEESREGRSRLRRVNPLVDLLQEKFQSSLPVDPKDAVAVSIRRLRLEIIGSKRRIELEADPDAGPRDIYAMMNECLNRERLRVQDLKVKSATLVFEFKELGERKAGTASVDVTFPSSCNLRNQRPERVEIIQKYLLQWGIDVRSGDSRPAAPPRHGTASVA